MKKGLCNLTFSTAEPERSETANSVVAALEELKREFKKGEELPRVLLVDDDITFGRIMIKFAERAGIQLTYRSSVRELEHAYFPGFDIALVDYDLQNISGVQLVQWLQCTDKRIPVVLISAYQQLNIPPWATSIAQFVPKSVGPLEILCSTLRAYLQLKQHKEEL